MIVLNPMRWLRRGAMAAAIVAGGALTLGAMSTPAKAQYYSPYYGYYPYYSTYYAPPAYPYYAYPAYGYPYYGGYPYAYSPVGVNFGFTFGGGGRGGHHHR